MVVYLGYPAQSLGPDWLYIGSMEMSSTLGNVSHALFTGHSNLSYLNTLRPTALYVGSFVVQWIAGPAKLTAKIGRAHV